MPDYRVQLDTYSGPMDLLLYLIRRDEVDIYDIPIARILEQYLSYVRVLEALDPDTVGDFLVLAATLMEIKSRLLLPKPPPEADDDDGLDPRADLVRQLLAYRAFREAAGRLSDRAQARARQFGRPRTDVPVDDDNVDIEDVQIWDLLTAFNKLLASVGKQRTAHEVVYDDTPITLHAADIQDLLVRDGPAMRFEDIFAGRPRGEMIGLFLALLELIRQDRVRIEQRQQFGTIVVHLLDATPITEIGAAGLDAAEGQAVPEAEDAYADAPLETPAASEDEAPEAVFEDEEFQEEADEFSRRIDAVQVCEVDLGRSTEPAPTADAPPEEVEIEAGRDAATTDENAHDA